MVVLGGVYMDFESSIYKNLISHIDINRSVDSIKYINFRDVDSEAGFKEFLNDINLNNDIIELNLIKNKAYKEAVIMTLSSNVSGNETLVKMIKEEQRTFGGSKLFYLNDSLDKILVVSVARSMDGKLNMVINRLNKINDKITRLNSRIKKENLEVYMKRQGLKDKKDFLVNMINKNLKV